MDKLVVAVDYDRKGMELFSMEVQMLEGLY
jgi:hypothetical protein